MLMCLIYLLEAQRQARFPFPFPDVPVVAAAGKPNGESASAAGKEGEILRMFQNDHRCASRFLKLKKNVPTIFQGPI